jgi:hypothetical protein
MEVWHSGRVPECKPEERGSSLSPELLLLKLSSSVEEVRHLETISLTAII